MKTITSVSLLIYSIFISVALFAGGGSGTPLPPPPGMPPCAVNPDPGPTACAATPICNVHGFCGTTDGSYTADYWSQLNSAFCGSIENNAFLSFTAESSTISFDAYVYNCSTDEAIQVMIFSAANCGSGPVTNHVCVNHMYANNAPYSITANGLIPGNQYYIMIDGFAGDVCDYTFVATDGVALPLGLDIGDNVTICLGETVTPTAYGGDGTYTWDPSPDLSATSGATITITPPATVGSYQYVAHSQGGVPNCPTANSYTLTVNVEVCCAIIDNNVSLLSCDAPNGVYSVTGEVHITGPTTVGDLVIQDCNGNTQNLPLGSTPYTYTINGLDLNSPSCNIEAYFSSTSECSHVLTHVLTYTAPTTTTPTFDPITVCEGEQAPLLPTTSLEGITGTWSPATINTSITGVTNYTFTPGTGYCSPSVNLGVNINPQPDLSVVSPVTLDCSTSPEVQIEGTSSTPGVTYSWSDLYGGTTGIISGETTPIATVNSIGTYILSVTNTSTGCIAIDTVTVVGNGDEPQVSIDPPIDLDCNTTTTTLVGHPVNSSGTQDNLTYEWSTPDGSITSSINGTTADIDGIGTYVLTVTDQINGCITSAVVLVDGNLDIPVITLETPILEITCEYPIIPLGATTDTGPIGTWTASLNGNIIQVGDTLGLNVIVIDAPGTYTYSVTDPISQCSASVDVVITENTTPPSVSAGPDLALCPGSTAILQGQGSSSTGAPITYSWDATTDYNVWLYDFSNIPNPEVPAAAIFILHVTDESNGCTASDTMQVIEHVPPVIFNDTTLCGASFQVPSGSVSVVGTFVWSELNGNGSFDDSTSLTPEFTAAPGSYELILTDACTTVSANVTIHSVPAASSPSDNCDVPKELLTNSPFGGTWYGTGLTFTPSSTVSGGTTVTTASTTVPGTYNVTFTANDNGISSCAFNESFTLIFPVDVSIFADTTVCAASFQVPVGSVTGSGSGQWTVLPAGSGTFTPSNTELHPTFTPNSGVINVTLIYEDVCDSDTAVVIFPPQPVVSTPPSYSCNDMHETLYTTSYGGGVWSVLDNPSTPWHEDTAILFMPSNIVPAAVNSETYVSSHPTAGTYTLTFTDNICGYTQTVTLNFLPYPWTEINDTTLCLGVSYQLSAAESPYALNYQWNTGATGTSITVTQSGVYYVQASNQCYSVVDSASIVFEACDITAPNVISISSQSGNNIWYVNAAGVADFHCIIVNRWGNLIYEYSDVNGHWDGRDRSGNIVSEGVYFYKLNATLEGGEKIDKHGFIQVVH